jgi:hypothetical protein
LFVILLIYWLFVLIIYKPKAVCRTCDKDSRSQM